MKKMKVISIAITCCLAFALPVSAAGFQFSFITATGQYGREGTKPSGDPTYSVKPTSGSLSTSKYITVYVRNPSGVRISEYATLYTVGVEKTGQYIANGSDYTNYSGRVILQGNPNAIGPTASGTFTP